MTRGQDGSLLLILYDSFIHDSTPVYPDAPQGRLYYRQQTYFVSEALASERVRVDELDGKLLVTFRHMTVREIELRTGKSRAVMLSVKKRK